MQEESVKTGQTNKKPRAAARKNKGGELAATGEDNLTLIDRLNRELAESGQLYAELSADEPGRQDASGQTELAFEDSQANAEALEGEDQGADATTQEPQGNPDQVVEEQLAEPAPAAASDASINDVAFALIPEALRATLSQKGYQELTTVQHAVLDPRTKGRDLQVSSQTGSGKTVALGILIAEGLISAVEAGKQARPLALVITPTRELASQVQKELHWLFAKVKGLSVSVCTGGTSVGMERRELERGPAVVVGTPGRLLDHITSGALKCEGIAQVVLDEADQMLDMGFREELEGILERTPKERSTHMVSATFPAGIQKLAHRYQNNPAQAEGTRLGEANADIEHVAHLLFEPDRYAALVNLLLLTENERVLIFVNTRADTTEMAEALSKDGFSAMPLSGELVQAQRTRTLGAFRSGAVRVLVATDVAARGLDIPDVNLVIQAATPMDAEIYIHRSGRTGRAGQKGRCVLLIPARRERRLKRMLNDAGVDSNWCDIPTREQVEKALSKRSRKRLFEAIDDESDIAAEDLAYAKKLVEERDPTRVVATLLKLAKPVKQREAMDIEPAQPFSRGWKHKERERVQEQRGPGAASPARQQSSSSEFVRFNVSWGLRDGASPQRLLAMLCRRGDIAGRMVGSIDLGATESSFEVQAAEAAHFEKRASMSDPREPSVRIFRGTGGAGPSGAAGHREQPQRSGYQGRGGGDRNPGAGYRPGAQRDHQQGPAVRSFQGGERSYSGARSYGNGGGYHGRAHQEQSSSGYQGRGGYQGGGYRGGASDQRSGGYQGGGQRSSGAYQGNGYQGGSQRSSGGYQGGGYQGGGQRSSGGYQGGGYQGAGQGDRAPEGGGYGSQGAAGGAPKRGFQKRDNRAENRPYGRHTGYRSNSGDHSSEGGYRGRSQGKRP